MSELLEKFNEAFKAGKSYEEAARLAGITESETLAEYWNILTMEAAIQQARTYFDKLLELAA